MPPGASLFVDCHSQGVAEKVPSTAGTGHSVLMYACSQIEPGDHCIQVRGDGPVLPMVGRTNAPVGDELAQYGDDPKLAFGGHDEIVPEAWKRPLDTRTLMPPTGRPFGAHWFWLVRVSGWLSPGLSRQGWSDG